VTGSLLSTSRPAATAARWRVPIPAWARFVAALLVGAELLGYGLRVLHAPSAISHPLSMELPFSLPRLLIATLFVLAAVAAATGAARLPRRRSWWTAVALLCALGAVVKGGSTVHKAVLEAVDGYAHPVRTLVGSAVVGAVVLAGLFWLSREERRDRRRVLRWLGAYGCAAGGLTVLSGMAEAVWGHGSALTATFVLVEESAEALTALGVLVAVLVGCAPRLVFAADRDLRRADDEVTTSVG
jgi:cytochrome bd-type quinol oxidase subunit 2